MSVQKRVAAVHDLSCVGKCSLTAALPVLSAAGIEACPVPTAVLSTHTGDIAGFTYHDMTEQILPIINHWLSLGLTFDAIYTGYLGSFRQLDIVSEVIDKLRTPENLVIVDPVMADNGKLYTGFTKDFPAGMRALCKKADIIVPNITEACFLLDIPYHHGPYDDAFIGTLLHGLAELGPKQIVLTGVYPDDGRYGAACYDTLTDRIDYALTGRIDGIYHGTGDLFASALTAALLNGRTLPDAAFIAAEFIFESIERTKAAGTDVRFGVNFEAGLSKFASLFSESV
ncbi:MAG TPA: pyridoxamine kinase [Papillibacter sp.]|jgi:pyridoxine kinase|nr:pyridoxamine kinase [Papillibacter sp.]